MSSTSDPTPCADHAANSNPDISGVFLPPDISPWLGDALTLFQALQVSNLVWLANFGTFFALASYSRQKAASRKDTSFRRAFDYRVKFGAMAQSLVSLALTLYMWASAKQFGKLSECSHLVNYIFFVIEVRATEVGRTLSLVITSILTASYLMISLQELRSYRRSYLQKQKKQAMLSAQSPSISLFPHDISSPENLSPRVPSSLHLSSSITLSTAERSNLRTSRPFRLTTSDTSIAHGQSPHKGRSSGGKRRPGRRRWSSNLDPMLVGIIICQAMVFTYFIVSTELLLNHNPSKDQSVSQWGFGQILALVVVLPSALSLIGALEEHGVKRRSRPKRTYMEERRHRKRKEDPKPETV
ncbi:hypothetical protein LshimejAT787_0301610 [Lyophyllum shimeji]|uniref:Uncharacterized protein n=1 Tax=Lyophyllum shimeji TaxID=47721 RepID=A0A9P3UJP3_LYOSH|nr:hypothetical protein LshimejAT787_0301610 [Lyophyllum shimeji]